ncbi:MAG: hypothetical protein ACI841_001127 [Planctomycetota bacterium]|jgi:hypothetical protein
MKTSPLARVVLFAWTLSLCSAAAAQECVGCTPLSDLGAGLYQGQYMGGLYPGGLNTPPSAHRMAAIAAGAQIVPLDAAGSAAPDGIVGMVSITMSNANQEFSAFERHADQDWIRGAQVAVINGAQGGQALDGIANPNAPYWSNLDMRLTAAGLSSQQVQVVWLKMAQGSVPDTSFPNHADSLKVDATTVLQNLKTRFPNLQIAYLSSRIYGGYAQNPQRGEPLSYETGFATKWLIEDQINGVASLNHAAGAGPVVAPLLLWGPYLWANGNVPRSDGLLWLPSDMEGDGVHPSEDGEQKVAGLLQDFFRWDSLSGRWYGRPEGSRLHTREAIADAMIDTAQPSQNFGSGTELRIGESNRRSFMKFDLSGISGTITRAKLSFRVPSNLTNSPGTTVRGVSSTSWEEGTITAANAPAIDGALHGSLPTLSRGTATSVDVTPDVLAANGGLVSFALAVDNASSPGKVYMSRETGVAPRLVLTVIAACDDPAISFCPATENSTGQSSVLALLGSASLTSNDMSLESTLLPASQFALFFYGFNTTQAAFGDGTRCISGGIQRLNPPTASSVTGNLSRALDFSTAPFGSGPTAVIAGDTVNFQCWYRDPAGGPGGFNLSGGVQVRICP